MVHRRALAKNGFIYCNLMSADRLCGQQVTANSSHFHPEKWVYGSLSPKSGVQGVEFSVIT